MMKLDSSKVSKLVCAKTYTESPLRINCIDYTSDGKLMMTSCEDDSVQLYNMETGQRERSVNSKKYGVDLIRFAHTPHNAIHSSAKVDDTIRYLSLHDNKYIRYFQGHTKKVICLCMSPVDDMFLSGSLDKTIRLWDMRSNTCQGLMQVSGKAIAAFDPEGLIFAAGINNEQVKLYDLRSFDKGPFTTFKMEHEPVNVEWTGMSFSPCGKMIMLNTNGNHIRIVDSFTGTQKHFLVGHRNDKDHVLIYWHGCPAVKTNRKVNYFRYGKANHPQKLRFMPDLGKLRASKYLLRKEALEAAFTPDSQFVFCGSSDAHIYAWSMENGQRVARLPTEHDSSLKIISWNPKYFMMASACNKVCFWISGDETEN